ncbi:polysaccharide biosynthesis/export family protein [Ovoidimarina sediminis]|uniref:polysaccharide biosynthesis/export family protein n=1 Tax=Ovoidimarina sediminis TaxID=3079856 RepID=UPI002906C74C|nr:polysaccharide biosynthesis/export family protein [Rhodophyticola sp. MJ-SS7]MDU8945532.1 polysaccharide biosynthesis/export family protein [Rhodophyticola sp. MJ-SS7]
MTMYKHLICSLLAFIAATVLSTSPLSAEQEYLLQPGDQLTVSISGLLDSTATATVQADGRVIFPHFGDFQAMGKSREELQRIIGLASIGKIISFYTPVGDRFEIALTGDDVFLDVSGYRPIYVTGDVGQSGEIKYFPGITLRMAVAGAGGLSGTGGVSDSAMLRAPDLRSRWETLTIDHANAVASLWRVNAALANDPDLEFPEATSVYIDEASFEELLADARREVTQLLQEKNRRKSHLDTRFETLEQRIELLSRALENQRHALAIEEEDLARMEQLGERGLTSRAGISNARQALLGVSTSVLDVEGRLAQLILDRDELLQEIDTTQLQFEQPLLSERASIVPSLWSFRSRINAAREALLLNGVAVQVAGQEEEPDITYKVARREGGTSFVFRAELDTLLSPGDVLNVEVIYPDRTMQQSAEEGVPRQTTQ